jgi:DNA-binding MarR family transcriptional regulator
MELSRRSASWHKLVQSVQAVEVSLERALTQQFGFGLTDFRALVLLANAKNRELRMQDLATKLALNQSSVTRLVERLERLGLTTRDVCPDDKRGVFSVLSDRGAARLTEAAPLYEAQLEEALSAHSETLPGIFVGAPTMPTGGTAALVSDNVAVEV